MTRLQAAPTTHLHLVTDTEHLMHEELEQRQGRWREHVVCLQTRLQQLWDARPLVSRRSAEEALRNAFELGRDYERRL